MPLPKPPARKAAILSPADFEAQAAPRPEKKSSRARQEPTAPIGEVSLLDAAVQPAAAPVRANNPAQERSGGAAAANGQARAGLPTKLPAQAMPLRSGTEPAGEAKPKSRRVRGTGPAKLFVLDTNVLMHDPMSLFRFEEHDVFLPMITLEELDGHKKGMSEVARNARQVSRELDALATFGKNGTGDDPKLGIPLAKTGHKDAQGKLFFQTTLIDVKLPDGLPQGKADNQILGVVQALRNLYAGREVVLVSKDINMRIKARALGLDAEDYFNDKTLEDGDLLYTGVLPLPADFWERHGKTMESWQQSGHTFYRISGPMVPVLMVNQFVYLEQPGAAALYARVTEITGKTAVLKTLKDYTHAKNAVWGVTARNREQKLRAQPADGPGLRLREPDGHGRHRQDIDDLGGRPEPGAG